MKNADFVALLTANAAKTKNVKCYSKVWPSGARRVPTYILNDIGRIVSLIQAKINEGIFCNPEKEGVLVYNFQPAMIGSECQFCTLDMLIVPLERLEKTWELIGSPFHIAVNIVNSEVMNNTKSMLEMGLIEDEEIESEGLDPPVVYGKYTDYEPTTTFLALSSSSPFAHPDIFSGKMDNSDLAKNAVCFDTHVQAQEYLKNDKNEHQIIGEIEGTKSERDKFVNEGISHFILKLISPTLDNVRGTSNKEVKMEARVEDEIKMLLVAHKEDDIMPHEVVKISGDIKKYDSSEEEV